MDPQKCLNAINGNFGTLDQAALKDYLSPPRPKRNEVDQDSLSPLYKTDDFRIYNFKVGANYMLATTLLRVLPFRSQQAYSRVYGLTKSI